MRILNPPVARVAHVRGANSLKCCAKLKMSEVRVMTTEEIDAKVTELKTELLYVRMAQAAREKFTPSDMPAKRRDIARLLTARREKEIEQGISKRDSRKMEKRKGLEEGLGR
jgi:ribosomal protein L29